MFPELPTTIPLQPLNDSLFVDKGVYLSILRTDKTDPIISGNKWFKLKYNLIEAQKQGYSTLVSFGGPYSNHLHALASAGKLMGFKTMGIIRGEEHRPLNPTLSDVTAQGMSLYYIDRKTYRQKHTSAIIEQLTRRILSNNPGLTATNLYWVPEGGTNLHAIKGASEIANFIPDNSNYVCVPCGTGGTIAGIINGLAFSPSFTGQVIGFPAMKGGEFLNKVIPELLKTQYPHTLLEGAQQPSWRLLCNNHFGGFGKINRSLAQFIRDFEKKHNIELDPIYTAKMMYAIVSLISDDFFPEGSQIVAVHTGGLQGKRGMEQSINALLSKDKSV